MPDQNEVDLDSPLVQAAIQAAVQQALAAANLQNNTPSPQCIPSDSPPRDHRSLTADLRPNRARYVPQHPTPVIGHSPSNDRVYYPDKFSDHEGEVEYDAWKMDMKLLLEEHAFKFDTPAKQVNAYYASTKGRAKKLLLPLLAADHPQHVTSADEVIEALDEEFLDYNKAQSAKQSYNKLFMTSEQTYLQFRIRFRQLAQDAGVDKARWFDDTCEKINARLSADIKLEQYRLGKDYKQLDEILQVADRENANIKAKTLANKPKLAFSTSSSFSKDDPRGILKKESWRGRSPEPDPTAGRSRSPSPAATPETATCFTCGKKGHISPNCPESRNKATLDKSIAELVVGKELDSDELSENY